MNEEQFPHNGEHENEPEATTAEEQQQTEGDEAVSAKAFRQFVHHQRVAIEELGRAIESLFPQEFREHTSNAGKAFVDSFRSLVDAARDEFSASNSEAEANGDEDNVNSQGPSATKIKVEID